MDQVEGVGADQVDGLGHEVAVVLDQEAVQRDGAGAGRGIGPLMESLAQRWPERATAAGEDAADDGDATDAGRGRLGQGLVEAGEDLGATEGVFRQRPAGDGDAPGAAAGACEGVLAAVAFAREQEVLSQQLADGGRWLGLVVRGRVI
ncbi:hypothetical protein Thiofri_00161 [Thiorhodovibrio frisius]|nr:hypothetical protein Thiofri_00161 [Thiorhodovibrio frisius]